MSYKSTHTGAQVDAGVTAALNPDATPTPSSTNLVTSGGVASKLSEKQDTLVFDNAPTSGSNNPVKSGGIYNALADKASNGDLARKAPLDSPTFTGTPTAPTPTAGDDSAKVATTAFVRGEIDTADAALEQMILASFPTDSISNVPVASFADGADGIPVKALTVNITPVQAGSGDPSPVNQRPISGWTGAIITRADKNLFNPAAVTEHYYIAADGTVTPFEDAKMSDYIKVSPGKWILDSAKLPVGSAGMNRIHCYDANKGWIAQLAAVSNGRRDDVLAIPITVPEGTVYIRFSMPLSTGGYTQYLQFERGEIATDYGAYSAETYAVSWQSEAGTVYGGTLTDNGDGTWTLTGLYGGKDMGDLSYTYDSNGYFKATINGKKETTGDANKCKMLSIGVDVGNMSASSFVQYPDGTISSRNNSANFWLRWSATTDKDVVKAAVAGQTIVYELATPIEYTLTAKSVKTLPGDNNIFADCGDIAALTYRADVGLYIAKKLAEAANA